MAPTRIHQESSTVVSLVVLGLILALTRSEFRIANGPRCSASSRWDNGARRGRRGWTLDSCGGSLSARAQWGCSARRPPRHRTGRTVEAGARSRDVLRILLPACIVA